MTARNALFVACACALAHFRWYSPTKAFFDRSWKMGNIVEVKE
jgi:hypothetical protein